MQPINHAIQKAYININWQYEKTKGGDTLQPVTIIRRVINPKPSGDTATTQKDSE